VATGATTADSDTPTVNRTDKVLTTPLGRSGARIPGLLLGRQRSWSRTPAQLCAWKAAEVAKLVTYSSRMSLGRNMIQYG
jgi:hypothetical protein